MSKNERRGKAVERLLKKMSEGPVSGYELIALHNLGVRRIQGVHLAIDRDAMGRPTTVRMLQS